MADFGVLGIAKTSVDQPNGYLEMSWLRGLDKCHSHRMSYYMFTFRVRREENISKYILNAYIRDRGIICFNNCV